jgi:hypothetical protein
VNDQFGCLLPFGRAWPFSATLFLVSGIWVRLVQSARPDRWPRRQAFQARDLRAQSLDLRLLLGQSPATGASTRGVRCSGGTSIPAIVIGLAPSMYHKKHQNRPPSKGQFHGIIEKLHFVYLSATAAQYLAERHVSLVGVDYLSVGGFRADGVETHQAPAQSRRLDHRGLEPEAGPTRDSTAPLLAAEGPRRRRRAGSGARTSHSPIEQRRAMMEALRE